MGPEACLRMGNIWPSLSRSSRWNHLCCGTAVEQPTVLENSLPYMRPSPAQIISKSRENTANTTRERRKGTTFFAQVMTMKSVFRGKTIILWISWSVVSTRTIVETGKCHCPSAPTTYLCQTTAAKPSAASMFHCALSRGNRKWINNILSLWPVFERRHAIPVPSEELQNQLSGNDWNTVVTNNL